MGSVKVSHVTTAYDTRVGVMKHLTVQGEEVWCDDIELVTLDWMTECLRQGCIVEVTNNYRLSLSEEAKREVP